jgi:hypothetical protein
MKINLDDTIMQSKSMTAVCRLLDEMCTELRRLSRSNSNPDENTRDLISKGKYVSNINKKRLSTIRRYKRA